MCYFNPRPREEGDRPSHYYPPCGRYFNPRPREEGDVAECKDGKFVVLFQSTPS